MNWRNAFHFLLITLFTLVGEFLLSAPIGFNNFHQVGKTKSMAFIAPSGLYTCNLNELGWINCWGANVAGQFGNGTTSGTTKPMPIRSGIIQLDTARTFSGSSSGTTYAITLTGVLMSWGDNIYGKMGTNLSDGVSYTPQVVDANTRYKFVSAQYKHVCAITATDHLKCWGDNGNSELGDGTTNQRNTPVSIDGSVTYKTVAVGAYHSCGITTDGVLKCWGNDNSGQVGDGGAILPGSRNIPTIIDSSINYASVSVGLEHSCGITTAGVLKCWGKNDSNQLGDGTTTNRTGPTVINSGTTYTMVAAADDSTCGITVSGELKCWGKNDSGQLGTGDLTSRSSPTTIDSGLSYSLISMGGMHTCGITTSKVTKCWGNNSSGQLGIGNTINQSSPQAISSP